MDELHRYALEIDLESGRGAISIPVSNQMVDYEDYYWLDNNHPIRES